MDNNYIRTGIFISFVYLLINDMTSKFIAGFVTGIFVSTKYDFKPYVNLVEDKIISLQKELESKKEESKKEESKKEESKKEESKKEEIQYKDTVKPQMVDQSWFNWPWSNREKN